MALTLYRPRQKTVPIRGVLFDMDGLVLDTEKLYSRFWMEACHFFGYPMTYEQALKMRAMNRYAGTAMLQSFFGPGADYDQIRAKRIELMDAFIAEKGVDLKSGVFELLAFLKENHIACAITSSSPPERIRSHLAYHGLDTQFDRLCSSYEVSRGKPEPDIYLHGAACLGLRPEECLALEDAPSGILSAWRAGCLPVMIPDQDQPAPETAELLYAKADCLTDVIGLLK